MSLFGRFLDFDTALVMFRQYYKPESAEQFAAYLRAHHPDAVDMMRSAAADFLSALDRDVVQPSQETPARWFASPGLP